MSAAAFEAGARSSPRPRWARIGPVTRSGVWLAVLVLFCVSGGMLWLVGYNYDGLTGSAATKVHPSTYLIVLTFAWSLLSSGDPVSRTLHLANRRPATLLMLAVSFGVIVVTMLRDGAGFGGLVDTYVAACLLVLLLADADEPTLRRLETILHLAMAANAVLALGEFVGQVRLFPYRFDGAAFLTDTRSAGLHGHPLANAMVTACYLIALLNGSRWLPAMMRLTMIGLQSAALVVFGGRTAVLVALALGLAYGSVGLLRALKHGRIPLIAAAAAFMLAAMVPAAIGALVGLGFFDDLIARFVSDGGSANARREMFELLGMFSLGDLIVGPDHDLVETLRRVNGLEWGIENPIIRMTLYQGALVMLVVMLAFGLFMHELIRVTNPGLWLPMIVWIILLNGAESIASKTTLPAKFAVIALCMYRPEKPGGPKVTAPSSGRAP
jgi:hypothetical protein